MSDAPKSVEQRFAEIVAEVRCAERERISAIMNLAEAAGRRTLAEHLAFSTDSTVEEATTLMRIAGKSQPPELRSVARTDGDSLTTKGNP